MLPRNALDLIREALVWATTGAVIGILVPLIAGDAPTARSVAQVTVIYLAANLLIVLLAPVWRWIMHRAGLEETKLQ